MSLSPLDSHEGEARSLPKRIDRLYELANNLWWSWDEDGRQVFRSLDYALWRISNHNPVKQLRDITPQNLESAQNIFIEGDNLEAVKLLYKPYFGKIKMIYIDPPYNTGNDFVYGFNERT